MKIFYAVQATGNGHISRAMTLLPFLNKYGSVDIFLSGDNSHLDLNGPVKYRSRGISLYFNNKGGLNYRKTASNIQFSEISRDIRKLPVEKYDLVINDFDLITSLACRKKKVPFVHFGHQASFLSNEVPRPRSKKLYGEWLLKNYARSPYTTGLHFERYSPFIFEPVIKQNILESLPEDHGHITVYLPAYKLSFLIQLFSTLPGYRFEIFTPEKRSVETSGNCVLNPVSNGGFNKSFINCHGIICGAGFETPAEAIHLGKKILAIPIRGQYEQQCNAAALETMNATVLYSLTSQDRQTIQKWLLEENKCVSKDYSRSAVLAISHVFAHLNNYPIGTYPVSMPTA
ncbi:MAG: glycosyl transferase [Chitinophagaceae bacterium]|nr:glycosyl transferase [Chitinophagaceae bacterium]